MKTEAEIRSAIAAIEKDRRLKAKPATLDINAPLALIQCNMEGQLEALRWVLKNE